MKILRELRIQQGITLETLATAVGLTPGHLSQLERGRASPSVSTLTRLADYYRVPVAFFFEDDVDGVTVMQQGSHLVLQPEEGGARFQLLSPDLNRRIEFLLITIDPNSATHSHYNRHPGEEVHFVLHGSLEVEVGGQTYLLATGDSIHFQSTLPHRLRNPKAEPALIVTAMTPPTRWSKAMLAGHGGRVISKTNEPRGRPSRKSATVQAEGRSEVARFPRGLSQKGKNVPSSP